MKIAVCKPDADPTTHNSKSELHDELVDVNKLLLQHQMLINTLRSFDVKTLELDIRELDINVDENVPKMYRKDITFVRDPVLCIGKLLIQCRMKHKERKYEPTWVVNLLKKYKPSASLYTIKYPGVLEGGDVLYIGNKTVFVGIGPRSNMNAVKQLQDIPELNGFVFVVVQMPKRIHPKRIHLDCVLGIVSRRICVLWQGANNYKTTIFQNKKVLKSNGTLKESLYECGFKDIISVSNDAQNNFACNLLSLHKKIVITQEPESTQKLVEKGFIVKQLDFSEFHKMRGGIHCATLQL